MANSMNRKPAFLLEVNPNEYNRQFFVGDRVTFQFHEATKHIAGVLVKKYTNSCLVDISQDDSLTEQELDAYNRKVVVNYKWINGVRIYE